MYIMLKKRSPQRKEPRVLIIPRVQHGGDILVYTLVIVLECFVSDYCQIPYKSICIFVY